MNTVSSRKWLALGDSYTIGEGIPLHESYPYQTLQLLRNSGLSFHAPEIIAKTGWTSNELIEHLNRIIILPQYDHVTLLIGVNNQYREMDESEYASTFEWLSLRSLELVGGNPQRITVISIPDWGVTPFAGTRDIAAIHSAIDRYNAINYRISMEKGFSYIDITTSYRETGGLSESVVADQLHPSGKVYAEWAEKLFAVMKKQIE